MTRTLAELDALVHDPCQTHLGEYSTDGRGPYPDHPAAVIGAD